EWPGTVLRTGLEEFVKAIIFYFFTVRLVTTERRFLKFLTVFLLCSTFRIIEPLYLNITQDYWGSRTSFGWDQVQRLAGSPYDIINSNGLAFVIASVLPFFHYIFWHGKGKSKAIYICIIPILLYTMSLTLSRTGIIAVVFTYTIIMLRSKHKA